jgi:hypothetical protein
MNQPEVGRLSLLYHSLSSPCNFCAGSLPQVVVALVTYMMTLALCSKAPCSLYVHDLLAAAAACAASEVRAILEDPKAQNLEPSTPDFWLLVAALRKFVVSLWQQVRGEPVAASSW